MDKGLIPEDVIQRIRERADIVEVVGSHLSLSKAGQNFKGLCPFHSEKTPSFTVSPSRQMFHCFGCGEGGNVFSFLMKIDGATFPAAVRTLGDKYGIEVDQPVTSPAARQRTEARERLFALNREAAEFLLQPRARCDPGGRERHTLRPVGIARELAQFPEFGEIGRAHV